MTTVDQDSRPGPGHRPSAPPSCCAYRSQRATTPPSAQGQPALPAARRVDGQRVLAATGALLAAVGLAGCAGETTPAQDDYAGRSHGGISSQGAAGSESPQPTGPAASPTAGPYADGTYSASQDYGPVDDIVKEDSIDVTITLSEGLVTSVDVVGHALTSTSQNHLRDFSEEIDEAVVGHSVEDAHVHALAGASKTSAAFNDAVDDIAAQAREAASSQGS